MHIPLFAACWQYPALFLVPLITSCFSFALRYSREIATVARHTIAEHLPALDLDALVERVRSIDYAGVPTAA